MSALKLRTLLVSLILTSAFGFAQALPPNVARDCVANTRKHSIQPCPAGSTLQKAPTQPYSLAGSKLTSSASGEVSFQQSSYPPIGANHFVKVDLNGDGFPDLFTTYATTTGSFGLAMMMNKGDGTFQTRSVSTSDDLQYPIAGDLNGDGRSDIAACVEEPFVDRRNIFVYFVTGEAHFSSPLTLTLPGDCAGLAMGDFDGDRKPDLAAIWTLTNPDGTDEKGISVYLGDATGHFSAPVLTAPASTVSTMGTDCQVNNFNFLAGDYDRDGKTDLLISANCSQDSWVGAIFFAQGDGSGHFILSQSVLDRFLFDPLRNDDVNQDGLLDMVAMLFGGTHSTNEVDLDFKLNAKDPKTPGPPTWQDTYVVGYSCYDCDYSSYPWLYDGLASDINGDGTKDAATLESFVDAGSVSPELHIMLANPDGSYGEPQPFLLPSVGRYLLTGDFDRDGRMDLVVVTDNSTEIFLNRASSAPTCAADPVVRSVKVCSPAQLTSNSLHLLANTTDSDSVTAMKVYVDNTERFYSPNDLINRVLKITNGGHRITTTAWDARGSFKSARWINVNTSFGCGAFTVDRSVNLCFPTNNATVGNPTQVVAAVRTSHAYHGVRVYVDGVSTYFTTSKQVNANLNLPAGKHRITLRAIDSVGSIYKTIYATVR